MTDEGTLTQLVAKFDLSWLLNAYHGYNIPQLQRVPTSPEQEVSSPTSVG
jgi:hypothetical protein